MQFCIPAETKQVIGTSTCCFKHLCGTKLDDRLPCQILGGITLAKQEYCFWILAEQEKSNWYQHLLFLIVWYQAFTKLADSLPCQVSGDTT